MRGARNLPLTLLLATWCGGQQPPPQSVIRVDVNLVQVEAIVTDPHGQRVPGLRPEDFQLLVDGKEKSLSHFTFVDAGSRTPALPSPTRLPRREDVHRTVVFMVDEVHTSPENMANLVPVLDRFVKEQVSPGDLISVMATRNNLGMYEQFTSDPARIRAALNRLVRLAGQHYNQIADQSVLGADRPGMIETSNSFFMEAYHTLAMAALARAIEALQDMPGRKSIVLFSDGIELPSSQLLAKPFQNKDPEYLFRMLERTKQVVNLANRAGVVFYTFDAKRTLSPELTPQRRASLQLIPATLAKETGGLFVHDTDGLSEALGKAMQDMSGYYLLGYTLDTSDADRHRGDDWNTRVRLKLRRSGLNVRTRSTFGPSPFATQSEVKTREDILRRALFSPFTAGAIRMRLSPVYSASPPDPKTGDRRSLLRALVSIDGRDVRLEPAAGGKKTAILDVAAVAFDADNRVVTSRDQRYTVELTAEQAPGFTQSSLTYQIDIPVPKPGAYQIRAAVRDASAQTAGSAGVFVEVPDFNKRRLQLSSLVLSGDDAGDDQGGRPTRTASRDFPVGRKIHYGFQVYGAKSAKGEGATNVDIELRLFRDGVAVFTGTPIPIAPDPGAPELTIYGSFRVPVTFSEGEYSLQVTAHDRLADEKSNAASQWIDLTLMR